MMKKVDFIYHSNGIEGIHTPKDAINEKSSHPLIVNQYNALQYVDDNCTRIPTMEDVINIHNLLLTNVDKYAGVLRTFPVYIGGQEAPKASSVSYMLENWLQMWNKKPYKSCTKKQAVLLRHYEYEFIHPFSDGNGRSGRLLMVWDCLRNGIEPMIEKCDNDLRQDYYERIRNYKSVLRDRYLSKWA
jgi:Fic family protein